MKFSLPLICLIVGIGIGIGWVARQSPDEKVSTPPVAKPSAGSPRSSLLPDKGSVAESPDKRGKSSRSRPLREMEANQGGEELDAIRKDAARHVTDISRKKFEAFLGKRSSELSLTAGQQAKIRAEMEQYFSEMKKRFVLSPEEYEERKGGFEYSALIDGNGLEKLAADVLTDEQMSTYNSIKAKERQSRIDTSALVGLGNLGTVLDLTQEQRDAAYGVLAEMAAKKEDSKKPAGVVSVFTEDSHTGAGDELGISAMMQARMETLGDTPPDEDEEKVISGTIKQQILERVEAMRPVLSEPQLQQYRTHLETTAAQSMNLYDIGRFSDPE